VISKSKVASFSISKMKVNKQNFLSFAFPAWNVHKTQILGFTR